MPEPELSVIIPTLNEGKTIAQLFDGLRQQTDAQFELIFVDGGSADDTCSLIATLQKRFGLNAKVINSQPGRAKQMNCGARNAISKELLFLHADTQIDDPQMLNKGLVCLNARRATLDQQPVAGHFGLRFQHRQTKPSLAYYFFESKTRLNRLDTINGDQGFMLSKPFFEALGGFDESLDYMEDARLARKIFAVGQWITLPGSLTTSARRFEIEGLKQRQILNALLCNFDHIGLTEFFTEAASAYRAQSKTGALELRPFFVLIHSITQRLGFLQSARLWYKSGAYVASNAWQLAFALDCRRNYTRQLPPGEGPAPALRFYERWVRFLIDSPPGHLIAAVLTFIWFYTTLLVLVARK